MRVCYEKSFLRDIKKLDDRDVLQRVKELLLQLENAASLQAIQNIKKLKGYDVYFRIKISDYRVGLRYEDGEINIIRFLHRKEIYRLFP